MRTIKIVSALLGAVASEPTSAALSDEPEPSVRGRVSMPGPDNTNGEIVTAGRALGRKAETPLAAAYPTQAARAALLDACLARAGEH